MDYIIGKKYRLLELHPEDAKMELVEEERHSITFKMPTQEESMLDFYKMQNRKIQTKKKHYRFKNREYVLSHR